MTPSREVPSWDDYFLAIADAVRRRSKDPSTQVGCVVADARHRVVATGYNGAPPGIDDAALDWSRPAKYEWVIHSELNALLHAPGDLTGCTLYVTGTPCSACMRAVAASGIRRVVYSPLEIAMVDEEEREKTLRIAAACGVSLERRESR